MASAQLGHYYFCLLFLLATITVLLDHAKPMHAKPMHTVQHELLLSRFHIFFIWHAAHGILRSSEFSNLQWDERSQPGCMADILRVHDWSYVRSIQHLCASIPDIPSVVGHLDQDTAISNGTFRAAQVAVGGICRAVDQVVSGQVRNASSSDTVIKE